MENSVLFQELSKLEVTELKKLAEIWNISKFSGKDKKSSIQTIYDSIKDEFLLKGVLEKLTSLQVSIFVQILKNKNVQTLGEITRKMNLPPLNAEMELKVLIKYGLVYQRKNRERLTNNLDKYHAYDEVAELVKLDTNQKGEKFRVALDKSHIKANLESIPKDWLNAQGLKKIDNIEDFYKKVSSTEAIAKSIQILDELERDTLLQIFLHGGVIEIDVIRNFIISNRGRFEVIIPKLSSLFLIFDTYYIDEKFIRIATIPKEVFNYLLYNPILPSVKKGTKPKQEKIACNDLDFFLNIKKLISFISQKGLNLAKSGKIKQADNKRTEQSLLKLDIDIFPEKGQVYQIELILPILKLLGLVDIKNENVILLSGVDDFQKRDIFEVMSTVIHEMNEVRSRRYNPIEVFSPTEVPFYDKYIFDKCINLIMEMHKVNVNVIFASIARANLVLSPNFKMKTFEPDLSDLRREILSAIFYLHLFGLTEVEYPNRFLSLSELGKYYFQKKPINRHTEKGGITINSDFSIIAFPEKCSILGIHLLKAFTELKDFDRVYTFNLTKDSFQQGILLGYDPSQFIQFLKESSKAELAQNLLFNLDDWNKNLPIVNITEDCVLVRTRDAQTMELLTGPIKGKKIILEEISPNAILIDKHKVQEVIQIAEKLNIIVHLRQ